MQRHARRKRAVPIGAQPLAALSRTRRCSRHWECLTLDAWTMRSWQQMCTGAYPNADLAMQSCCGTPVQSKKGLEWHCVTLVLRSGGHGSRSLAKLLLLFSLAKGSPVRRPAWRRRALSSKEIACALPPLDRPASFAAANAFAASLLEEPLAGTANVDRLEPEFREAP